MSQEFRLKNIDEARNYFHEEIEQNELMSRKQKKDLCNSKLYWTPYCSFYNYWMCLEVVGNGQPWDKIKRKPEKISKVKFFWIFNAAFIPKILVTFYMLNNNFFYSQAVIGNI